ncbi:MULTISPECIES: DUF2147 domain-containing protein [unclassified Helicobacter]|uniref:DUF2147 domain-containing protein n=1 Tax=unclassified Helicobacter TaxID=2593540 RepID=UPI000CF13601|nr:MULTISPECIES: DUF2147 domain-containing protein [unclassified Helicobacter]
MRVFIIVFVFALHSLLGDIAGYYLLPKNEDGVESVVRIFKEKNKYYAYGFASKNNVDLGLDTKNPNEEKRKQEIRGSIFLWDLIEKSDEKYGDGRIYNYVNGKTYYVKAEVKGEMLIVKASVDKKGLFGKTFNWKKLTPQEIEPFLQKDIDLEIVKQKLPQE